MSLPSPSRIRMHPVMEDSYIMMRELASTKSEENWFEKGNMLD